MSIVSDTDVNLNPAVPQVSATVRCVHCSLPVPAGLVDESSDEQFCCQGCRTAWTLIHSNGLAQWYQMLPGGVTADAIGRRDSEQQSRTFQEFDDPAFEETYCRIDPSGTSRVTLAIDGIHCAACVWLIEKLPQMLPGVVRITVNWARANAVVVWDRDKVALSQIARLLHQLGYTPCPVRESDRELRRQAENRKHLVRIGIAAAAAGNNMLIAAALYLGMFSYMSAGMEWLLRIASCVVGMVSLLGPGRVFLRGAWNAVVTRTPHMDLPVALGLTVGSVAGLVNTVRGSGEIWFDSLSVLVFLLLTGRWIQFRQQSRAADSVELLFRMTPRYAWKLIEGQPQKVLVESVRPGDELEIRVGELIPVDATVTDGATLVNESVLSGESVPVARQQGQAVAAGTLNIQSPIRVRADAVGDDTRISQIIGLVEQAALEKPAVVQWANRVGGYFVVIVIALAALTLAWWLRFDPSAAVDRTIALLIVACPCALALATPLAISVAIGRAARQQIMIKGGDVLQRLTGSGLIWLDKTGTLTRGDMQVVQWHGAEDLKPLAAALEATSTHPVARALASLADTGHCRVESVVHDPAGGISGVVDGRTVHIGNEAFMRAQLNVSEQARWQRMAENILEQGYTPIRVAVDNKICAVAALGDQVRPDAPQAIRELRRRGWQIGILSGDHQHIVTRVANQLGIDPARARGGVTPEDKISAVKQSLTGHDTVVMVGDGVNDSAALAAASAGIAVSNGAEASLAAAPVYLGRAGLQPILELMKVSQSAGRNIRLGLGISLAYNVIGVTLAMSGLINPLMAAVLMPISSLTVVAVSLGSGKIGEVEGEPSGPGDGQ